MNRLKEIITYLHRHPNTPAPDVKRLMKEALEILESEE